MLGPYTSQGAFHVILEKCKQQLIYHTSTSLVYIQDHILICVSVCCPYIHILEKSWDSFTKTVFRLRLNYINSTVTVKTTSFIFDISYWHGQVLEWNKTLGRNYLLSLFTCSKNLVPHSNALATFFNFLLLSNGCPLPLIKIAKGKTTTSTSPNKNLL